MSNKTQLQLNNETLGSVLSNVLGLPSQESLKHGAYVWKKYEVVVTPKIEVTNPQITITTTQSGTPVNITSPNFDLTKASLPFFEGFKKVNSTYPYIRYQNPNINIVWTSSYATNINSFTATNSDNGVFQLESAFNGASTTYDLIFEGTKTLQEEKTTYNYVDFVVSDSPTAYPDGGIHTDGYWYEKFQLDPALFECTKYAVDKFTYSANTSPNKVEIQHSLGITPRFYIITSAEFEPKTQNIVTDIVGVCYPNNSSSHASVRYKGTNGSIYSNSTTAGGGDAEKIHYPYSSNTPYFGAGIEYTLITMA